MMERLLTDREVDECMPSTEQLEAFLAEPDDAVAAALSVNEKRLVAKVLLFGWNVADAEHAKSIRVDRQAMAEWWMEEHADEYHEEGVRRNCPVCSDEYWLWVEGREGRAPWETD